MPLLDCHRLSAENALASLIEKLEQDRYLHEPRHLRQRTEALDDLDAYFPDGPDRQPIGTALHHRALAIYARLESVNLKLYQAIRRQIRVGTGLGSLREWMPDWRDGNGAANFVNCTGSLGNKKFRMRPSHLTCSMNGASGTEGMTAPLKH
jgi:hypothetical protein